MSRTRREMLTSVLALCATSTVDAWNQPPCGSGSKRDAPDATSLAAGDFLWPKRPRAIVPYSSQPGAAGSKERQNWEAEKGRYLKTLEAKPVLTAEDKERYKTVQGLTYDEFLILYLNDEDPQAMTPFGAIAPFYVGHVGIVEAGGNEPHVIEAVMGKGVQRLSYAAWRKGRQGELIWHGRLKGVADDAAAKIPQVAQTQVGKPYDFWNFDLSDDQGFYCSKLAWYAVCKATARALDDNNHPRRRLWYSPKQMLKSQHLCLINSPGNYTFR